ncbi:MAG: choice-of-anchor Q domain-containing protein [Saprospiraceae bacterium]|nr:hypothetical protein [Lewinellaceae bacterium]
MKQILLFFLLLGLTGSLSAQIFVKYDAAGANDGSSWANAYTTLDAALAAATPADQIWVAAGTYKPDAATANNSFTLMAGVAVYGGFNGTEATLAARNPATNTTILSGDLNGDDVAGNFTMNRTDNSRHVIQMIPATVPAGAAQVDGFTIMGGHTLEGAANPDSSRRGGGILATERLTVRNCTFTHNFAESGAGVMALGVSASGVVIDNCLFESNAGTTNSAGAYLFGLIDGEVNKCIFRNNTTNRGCLQVRVCANITIDSCLIENNAAPANTCAGLYTFSTISIVTNTIIRGNTANAAAGWYNDGRDGGDMLEVDNCILENNTATGFGGGFYNWQGTYSMKNSIFRGNSGSNAGGLYNDGREFDSQFSIENCLFENNTTTNYGGSGMFVSKSTFDMTNLTFKGNTAPSGGAGMYVGDTCLFLAKGCLFESNSSAFGAGIANFGTGIDATYENCTFMENASMTNGAAMINGFTAQVNLVNCTFEGNTSQFGGAISNQNTGTFLGDNGSYFVGNIATDNGGAVFFRSGILFDFQNTVFEANEATFGGAVLNQGVGNIGTYKGCQFLSNSAGTSGGAILNGFLGSIEVDSCLFEANTANFGGGIFCQNDSTAITVRKSRFVGNNADSNGGGVNIGAGIVFNLENSVFELNTADRGGAMQISEDSLDLAVTNINNCIIQDNFAFTQGAGLDLSDADVTITNCLFVRNQNFGAGAGGALINNATNGKTATVKIVNSTISENSAVIGGGLAQWEDPLGGNAVLELQNTILYNLPQLDYELEDGTPTVISNGGNLSGDVTLLTVLTGTNDLLQLDPQFVDAAAFDFHLKASSPCIDKGVATGAPANDLDGLPRQGPPDQGAYEWGTIATHSPKASLLPLRLMPNPAVERSLLVVENDFSGDARIQIIAQNGAVVGTFNTAKPAGRWAYPLDVRQLPAGVYSVQVLLGTDLHEGTLMKK